MSGSGAGARPAPSASAAAGSVDASLAGVRRLLETVARLRSPDGCPWDRSQTLASMAPFVLEEAYEAADAIAAGKIDKIREEIGDLLMVLVSAAAIAEEQGSFSLGDSATAVSDKLVRRHPHVFGETKVAGVKEVLRNWETIKREERAASEDRSAIAGIPAALPALLRAYRTIEKAARVGFDWEKPEEAAAKVDEEWAELRAAIATGESARIEEELGDTLLALAACARRHEVNPEIALRRGIERFGARFRFVEERLGKSFEDASAEEITRLWREAKEAARA